MSLVAVLVAAYAALVMVRALRGVLLMLLVSLFLSFAMEPAVQFLSLRGWRRGAATGAVFTGVVVFSFGALAAIVPALVAQLSALISNVPTSLESLNATLSQLPVRVDFEVGQDLRAELARLGDRLADPLQNLLLGAASNVVDIGATAVGALFQVLAIALVTFYLVADGPRARRALARPFPQPRQREMLAIWELAVAKTGGYIYSRLLLAVICAAAHLLFLLVLAVPFPVPLALWVGITSAFIPVIGTYLGGVLIVIVAFVNSPADGLWVLAFVALYQQVENYLLVPRISARTMDVHPAVAFVAVLVGGTLLGAVGALLALPATAIIQALLSTYVRRHELIDELDEVPLPVGPDDEPDRDVLPKQTARRVGTVGARGRSSPEEVGSATDTPVAGDRRVGESTRQDQEARA